jgi:hypothetical protein
MNMQITGFNQEYQFAADEVVGSAVWDQRTRGYRWFFQQPGARQWWSAWAHTFGEDFAGFTDGLIREGEAAG